MKMPQEYTISYHAKRIYSDGRAEDAEVLLARECPVELFLDGKIFTTLFASPLELKELAIGHLITEGAVNFRELTEIKIKEDEIHVLTQRKSKLFKGQESDGEVFVHSGTIFDPEARFAGTSHLESDNTGYKRDSSCSPHRC
jgi:FdhD protein